MEEFRLVPKTQRERRRTFFAVLAALLLMLPMSWLFGQMVHRVHGISMLPTIQSDCFLVVLWPWGAIDRGDIVVLEHEGERRWIKRVVGLPGDTIEITPGFGPIKVNGEPLEEPYLDPELVIYVRTIRVTLGPGEYYVLGDNRRDSFDSRFVGVIREQEILVTLSYWFQL